MPSEGDAVVGVAGPAALVRTVLTWPYRFQKGCFLESFENAKTPRKHDTV